MVLACAATLDTGGGRVYHSGMTKAISVGAVILSGIVAIATPLFAWKNDLSLVLGKMTSERAWWLLSDSMESALRFARITGEYSSGTETSLSLWETKGRLFNTILLQKRKMIIKKRSSNY